MNKLATIEEINNFYQQEKNQSFTNIEIQVISDVTFHPLDRYIPFFLSKFEVSASFKIGLFDQLNFDLLELTKKNENLNKIVYIHTSIIKYLVRSNEAIGSQGSDSLQKLLDNYVLNIKRAISASPSIQFILNLFELPPFRVRGSYSARAGEIKTISQVNDAIIKLADENSNVVIHDLNYISSRIGLDNWYDLNSWAMFKQPFSGDGITNFSSSLASVIASIIGKSKKVLFCDLDNTIWGGIIGDDGHQNIHIGSNTAKGELFAIAQSYILSLKNKGIILGISSKNDHTNAELGFTRKESILSLEDFSTAMINWQPKSGNIKSMLEHLNLGENSSVFIDDNKAEVAEVLRSLPSCSVIGFEKSPIEYIKLLDSLGFFETQQVTEDDLNRSKNYKDNSLRTELSKAFSDHDDFLLSLKMESNFYWNISNDPQRVTDLVNKTNQFNTTQMKTTLSEIKKYINNSELFLLSAELNDIYGNNGIITVVFGMIRNDELYIDNWVMSCRVFNRTMENAVLEVLSLKSKDLGIKKIIVPFKVTSKNQYCHSYFQNLRITSKKIDSVQCYVIIVKDYLSKIKNVNGSKISFKINQ